MSIKVAHSDQRGIIHHIAPLLVIVLCAIIGSYYLVASHADATTPLVYGYFTTNSTGPVSEGISSIDLSNNITSIAGPSTTVSYSPPVYSPNTNSLAWFSVTNGTTGQLNVKDLNNNQVSTYSDVAYNVSPSTWTPPLQWYSTSKKLAFVGNSGALYTVNSDGTGLAEVANTSNQGQISSLAVTDNGKYIAYTTDQGVFAVHPGSLPVTLNTGTNCSAVVSRPTTNQSVSYLCINTSGTSTVFNIDYQSIGSPASVLYSSTAQPVVGNTSNDLIDEAWSANGSKLALLLWNNTYQATCVNNQKTELATLAYANPGKGLSIVEADPTIADVGTCKGGPIPGKSLAWGPGGTNIAYIDYSQNVVNYKLYRVSSQAGANNSPTQLDATNYNSALTW
jgi:hypothetical protein